VERLKNAETVLADAAVIEADFKRLRSGRVLPRLQAISASIVNIEESERRTKELRRSGRSWPSKCSSSTTRATRAGRRLCRWRD
jgi:hypothetical protein